MTLSLLTRSALPLTRLSSLFESRASRARPATTLVSFTPAFAASLDSCARAHAGWHEVLTEPATQRGELCVSVNFWFAASNRILQPSLPLVPSMQCELARQLEYLVSDCLNDRARHVPVFLRGMLAALEVAHSGVRGTEAAPAAVDAAVSTVLHACRPPDVRPDQWQGVFEFVMWKLSLLIGAEHALDFTRDLLDPARFAQLELQQGQHRSSEARGSDSERGRGSDSERGGVWGLGAKS